MKKFLMLTVAFAAAGMVRAAIQPIPGENVVGLAPVAAPAGANTIITVPFEACLEGSGTDGMLSDLVATHGLTSVASVDDAASADQLVVLTTLGADQVYYYYWLQTGAGWTRITTEQIMPDGTTRTLTPPEANAFALERGLGFWIKRAPGTGSTVYVKGQVSSDQQATPVSAGLNLIGYATVASFTLNDPGINWAGAFGGTDGRTSTSDKILVVNADGSFTEYFYFVKPSGAEWNAYAALDNKWITQDFTLATEPLAAGQGFWYHRRGPGSFTFMPDTTGM